MKVTLTQIIVSALGTAPKVLENGIGRTVNQRNSGDSTRRETERASAPTPEFWLAP